MARVLVTDGETRTCLAASRALAAAGHGVYVAAGRLPALATVSRHCTSCAQTPAPRDAPEAAAAALLKLVERWAIDVVLPVTDISTLLVLRKYGARVGQAVVAAPELRAFELMSDKAGLLARAERAGLRIPTSLVVRQVDDLRPAVQRIGYPCVLKPHTSIVVGNGAAHSFGVRILASEREPVPVLPEAAFPLLVQEHLTGAGEGVFLLLDHGRVVTAFAHRRLREKPPEGGVSTYREAIALDHSLVEGSARLLADVGWHGAAMVEFRRTLSGDAVLMEVNGRLWGSLQLAVDAGVDFASLLVALFLGQRIGPVTSYRVGVRSRWEWGDIDHVLLRLARGLRGVRPPEGSPTLTRLLWDFFAGFARPNDRLEVCRRDDMLPFLRETLDWFRGRGT